MAGNPSSQRTGTQSATQQKESSALQQRDRSNAGRDAYMPSFGGGLFSMSPFALLREMTDLMDRSFGGASQPQQRGGRSASGVWAPAMEVCQQNNNLMVWADLPGIDPNDVRLEIENDQIVIQGERKQEHNEEREGFHRSERVYGSFYRSIPLPETAKADDIKAEFHNGVLQITVPLEQPKSNRRQIQIQRGSGTASSQSVTPSSTGTGSPANTATGSSGAGNQKS
jgi:HSP20 family protein